MGDAKPEQAHGFQALPSLEISGLTRAKDFSMRHFLFLLMVGHLHLLLDAF